MRHKRKPIDCQCVWLCFMRPHFEEDTLLYTKPDSKVLSNKRRWSSSSFSHPPAHSRSVHSGEYGVCASCVRNTWTELLKAICIACSAMKLSLYPIHLFRNWMWGCDLTIYFSQKLKTSIVAYYLHMIFETIVPFPLNRNFGAIFRNGNAKVPNERFGAVLCIWLICIDTIYYLGKVKYIYLWINYILNHSQCNDNGSPFLTPRRHFFPAILRMKMYTVNTLWISLPYAPLR